MFVHHRRSNGTRSVRQVCSLSQTPTTNAEIINPKCWRACTRCGSDIACITIHPLRNVYISVVVFCFSYSAPPRRVLVVHANHITISTFFMVTTGVRHPNFVMLYIFSIRCFHSHKIHRCRWFYLLLSICMVHLVFISVFLIGRIFWWIQRRLNYICAALAAFGNSKRKEWVRKH